MAKAGSEIFSEPAFHISGNCGDGDQNEKRYLQCLVPGVNARL